jgi:hypothetical protein
MLNLLIRRGDAIESEGYSKSHRGGGVNRRNLKIINFEHALHPGLRLEINKREFWSAEDSSSCYELLNQCG